MVKNWLNCTKKWPIVQIRAKKAKLGKNAPKSGRQCPKLSKIVKYGQNWVRNIKKTGVCRAALATPGQFTFVQGVSQKTWLKEDNNLHQDSKVGNKNDFSDNFWTKNMRQGVRLLGSEKYLPKMTLYQTNLVQKPQKQNKKSEVF